MRMVSCYLRMGKIEELTGFFPSDGQAPNPKKTSLSLASLQLTHISSAKITHRKTPRRNPKKNFPAKPSKALSRPHFSPFCCTKWPPFLGSSASSTRSFCVTLTSSPHHLETLKTGRPGAGLGLNRPCIMAGWKIRLSVVPRICGLLLIFE